MGLALAWPTPIVKIELTMYHMFRHFTNSHNVSKLLINISWGGNYIRKIFWDDGGRPWVSFLRSGRAASERMVDSISDCRYWLRKNSIGTLVEGSEWREWTMLAEAVQLSVTWRGSCVLSKIAALGLQSHVSLSVAWLCNRLIGLSDITTGVTSGC